MKIIAISDSHNYHSQLIIPPCDILIHCGDATGTGTQKEIEAFARWMDLQPAKHKIFSPGNHERTFEKCLPISKLWWSDYCPSGHLLIHKPIEIEGLKILCTPYTPKFFNWAFMKERGLDIKKYWEQIPTGIDILVCHGMPYGILDDVIDWSSNKIISVGCMDMLVELERIKPKIYLGGHLHMNGGKNKQYDNIMVYNCAVCDDGYQVRNGITEINL